MFPGKSATSWLGLECAKTLKPKAVAYSFMEPENKKIETPTSLEEEVVPPPPLN